MNTKKTAVSYSKRASDYEEKWQKYLLNTHFKLLSEFDSQPDDRILDVSAGTGLLAKYLLVERFGFSEMFLNDVSEGMLEIAKKRFSQNTSFSYSSYNVTALKFESSSFDTVICTNAFHHYANQYKALEEIRRVLKPGGELWLLDWNKKGIFKAINFFIKYFSGELIHTLSTAEAKSLLESSSFKILFSEEWRFQYWQLFLIRAKKVKSMG